MRLLCVENNDTLRKMIDLMLAATGIDVDFVSTGDDAVDAYQVNEYDAVVLDMDMGCATLRGLKTAREIRQTEQGFHLAYTPILFLSGALDDHQMILACEAGGDGHLMKPFTSEALIGAIERLMGPVRGGGLLRAMR